MRGFLWGLLVLLLATATVCAANEKALHRWRAARLFDLTFTTSQAQLITDAANGSWRPGWWEEIKLSAEQVEALKAVAAKSWKLAANPAEAKRTREQGVLEVLTPEQHQRLKEIFARQAGLSAFSDPIVAAVVRLSNEQQQQIAAATKEYEAAIAKIVFPPYGESFGIEPPPGSREDRERKQAIAKRQRQLKINQTQSNAALKKYEDRLKSIVMADQQQAWKDLLGAPVASTSSKK